MTAVIVASVFAFWLVGAVLVGARFGRWLFGEMGGWARVPVIPRADWIMLVASALAVGALWPYAALVVALVRLVEGDRP